MGARPPSKLFLGSLFSSPASPPDVRCRLWPREAAGAAWFASTGEAVGGEKLAEIPAAVVKRLLAGESELTTHFG